VISSVITEGPHPLDLEAIRETDRGFVSFKIRQKNS
jgi:hypothetical protein